MAVFKRIVADIDPRAERQPAIDRVQQLASAHGSRVWLIACEPREAMSGEGAAVDAHLSKVHENYRARIKDWLAEKAEMLGNAGIEVEARCLRQAPRYEAILATADDVQADLVMRAARHYSKIARLLVSATDWELIRHAPQTVWLVKKSPGSGNAPLNVLAAVDPVHAEENKFGLDQKILETSRAIANVNNGQLHVMHAWQPGAVIAPAIAAGPHVPMTLARIDGDTIDNMRDQRRALINKLVGGYDIPDERVHLVEGPVTDAIDQIVHEQDIDVVVAGGVSRGTLERLIIGSTAEAILENADCDVVIVKPDQRNKGDAKE